LDSSKHEELFNKSSDSFNTSSTRRNGKRTAQEALIDLFGDDDEDEDDNDDIEYEPNSVVKSAEFSSQKSNSIQLNLTSSQTNSESIVIDRDLFIKLVESTIRSEQKLNELLENSTQSKRQSTKERVVSKIKSYRFLE
jgi:hypothetical protein